MLASLVKYKQISISYISRVHNSRIRVPLYNVKFPSAKSIVRIHENVLEYEYDMCGLAYYSSGPYSNEANLKVTWAPMHQ